MPQRQFMNYGTPWLPLPTLSAAINVNGFILTVSRTTILRPFRRHKDRSQATRHRIGGNKADQRAVIDHCGNRIPRDGEDVSHRRGPVWCRTSETYSAVEGEREVGKSRVLTHAKRDKLSTRYLPQLSSIDSRRFMKDPQS